MDGTAVAFHKQQSRIVHPWKPESADGDLIVGAVFQERVFVRSTELRELLNAFTRSGACPSLHCCLTLFQSSLCMTAIVGVLRGHSIAK